MSYAAFVLTLARLVEPNAASTKLSTASNVPMHASNAPRNVGKWSGQLHKRARQARSD